MSPHTPNPVCLHIPIRLSAHHVSAHMKETKTPNGSARTYAHASKTDIRVYAYGVATISRLLEILRLFCKEPYKTDDILQKRPIILRILLIVATPYVYVHSHTYKLGRCGCCAGSVVGVGQNVFAATLSHTACSASPLPVHRHMDTFRH